MTYKAVDCQGFAGGFTLGMVQAGFDLVGKKEMTGGFGVPNCVANRHLLGEKWEPEVCEPGEWTPIEAEVVFGNPPCSGFSLMSHKDFRGVDSTINECMWAFMRLVARTRPLPQIAIFESVQQAFTTGRTLMNALHATLEEETRERWYLHHVLHNNASVGGSSIRKRYFWLVSRIPFGVEEPEVTRVPNLMDVIGDLEGLHNTWDTQPYRRPPSWWSRSRRREGGVDGHASRNTPALRRAVDLMDDGIVWGYKENISTIFRRYYEKHGRPPESWEAISWKKIVENDFNMGFHQMTRWHPERMARVITGGGLDLVLHPHENRGLTHREVARIQGFPDDWRIRPLKGQTGLHMTWGKGIPVDCGRWIGGWIRSALDGAPGSVAGEPGDQHPREYVINVTNAYRTATSER